LKIITKEISIRTKGNSDIIDITDSVNDVLNETCLNEGNITIFVSGSTGGITTVEYESGLVRDLHDLFEKIAPRSNSYAHNMKWHDGNGHSHILSALFKTSFTVPFKNGSLLLGTWQQIIFIDFDVKQRHRDLVVQVIGI
jgi:secondary thiamine-phosphate synthase enzyme